MGNAHRGTCACISAKTPAQSPSVCCRNNLEPRLGATLAPSGGNTKFWQQPLRQDYIGDKECDSPNPIGHVHPPLFANSKFTQEGHHRAPIGESRLKQVQANKRREEIPVRAYVVPKCQGQQNKAASDQTKCSFYSHSSSPSKQVGPTQFRIAVCRTQRHFLAHADAWVEASVPSERGNKEPALPSAIER